MGWYDEDRSSAWAELRAVTTDRDELVVLDFCQEKYPEHKPVKAIDNGDVLIYYLRYHGEKHNNFGCEDLVLYYNTWYAGEFNVSRLERLSSRGN